MSVVLREPLQNLTGNPNPAVANTSAPGNSAENPDSGFGSRPSKPADVSAPDTTATNPTAPGNSAADSVSVAGSRPSKPADVSAPDTTATNPTAPGNSAENPDSDV
jgi:hypothetical protein